jgi:uncharacterized membrane protein YgdD (TMEM256/DUF423 family)
MMIERIWLAVAALSGAAAVAVDAAARHLAAGDAHRLEVAATGTRYGLIHAAALMGIALLAGRWRQGRARRWLELSGWCFAGGLWLFPGSLYLLALGTPAVLAAFAPIGGSLFIVGWLALLAATLAVRPAD